MRRSVLGGPRRQRRGLGQPSQGSGTSRAKFGSSYWAPGARTPTCRSSSVGPPGTQGAGSPGTSCDPPSSSGGPTPTSGAPPRQKSGTPGYYSRRTCPFRFR
uniref:Uncharacterized protein n=1 Tax=Opuntia streptacantha TaxID=393608 RepID=A0A7C8ZJR0_OPUST